MSNHQTLISIVIPLYNKEQYFERCFISVVNQIYKNIECIIVEDCSADNSLKLAEQLIKKYTGVIKFEIIKHMHNYGASAARNTGINNSRGEYIYFLDSDDEITVNCIHSLVTLIEKYPGIDMVQGNAYQYPQVERDRYDFKGVFPEFTQGNFKIKKYYNKHFPVSVCNKLIKKSFVTQNILYFKPGYIHEDQHWHFFAIKYIETFAFTNEYCYIRYWVPDSVSTSLDFSHSITAYLMIAEDILSNLDIDFLENNLFRAHKFLKRANTKILSDTKYLHFLPKYKLLISKLPNGMLFLRLAILWELKYFKKTLFDIIKLPWKYARTVR